MSDAPRKLPRGRPFVRGADPRRAGLPRVELGATCPLCERDAAAGTVTLGAIGTVILKAGRFGDFHGCSRFPKCDFTQPAVAPTVHGTEGSTSSTSSTTTPSAPAPAVPSSLLTRAPEAMTTAATPAAPIGVDALLDQLRAALTAKPAAVDATALDALRETVERIDRQADVIATTAGRADTNAAALGEEMEQLRDALAPLTDLARRATTDATVRARVTLAAAATGSPILDKLTSYYMPGTEAPAHVCLTAPPGIGKTHMVRELGKAYDQYLEHGCTDDIDEIATLLGSPVPDGAGGFLTVDGVLTQAVRAASAGANVLLLLDEIFRLGDRAQEWLLSFLTGVQTPAGKVYQLRTRRAEASGTLEVISCPAARFHIVAAANLGPRQPIEAFWSRFEVVRIAFDSATIASVGASIATAYGITDAAALGTTFAAAVRISRDQTAAGTLRYPLTLRNLERACMRTTDPTPAAVCKLIAATVSDVCAHWGVDSGETDPGSAPAVALVVRALTEGTAPATGARV